MTSSPRSYLLDLQDLILLDFFHSTHLLLVHSKMYLLPMFIVICLLTGYEAPWGRHLVCSAHQSIPSA